MGTKLQALAFIATVLVFVSPGCKKESVVNNTSAFNLELLKGGTWTDYQNAPSLTTMKFRFYGNSNVTYTFRTTVYPTLKYDSFPHGRWEFIQPDTLRLYDRTWNCYGYLQVLRLSNSELHSRTPGYNDIIVFRKAPN